MQKKYKSKIIIKAYTDYLCNWGEIHIELPDKDIRPLI